MAVSLRVSVEREFEEFVKRARATMKLDGKKTYLCSVKMHRRQRTVQQNSLLWFWYNELRMHTGIDTERLHHILAGLFLPPMVTVIAGVEHTSPRSTKKLTTKQFSWYLEKIHQWALETDGIECYLPWPEDVGWEEFADKHAGE